MLELLVHTQGLPPPARHGYIWIDLPAGLSYERFDPVKNPGWEQSQSQTQAFGDAWAVQHRSCLLFVPSVIVPAPYENVLINPAHPEASEIRPLKVPRILRWDARLFQ